MMMKHATALAAVAVATLGAGAAHADEVAELTKSGPLVRVEMDAAGKLKQATCIADVDAPIELVWKVLNDYDTYQFFMPRIKKIEIEKDGVDTLLTIKLNTPFVSTAYTNRQHPDPANYTVTIKNVKGDLKGTYSQWKLVAIGDGKTRIFYGGLIQNYSSIAESFEDDQHTLSIGVNVVSMMASAKAVKERAETLQKQAAKTASR